jgi:hypothetical protein
MALVSLTEAKKGGETWQLELEPEEARLSDPTRNLVARIPRGAAEQRILLPSFSENRSKISVLTDDNKLVSFNPDKPAIAEIKSYFNAALAAAGPEAIAALRGKAIRDLAIGVIAAAAGIGLTVLSYLHPTEKDGTSKSTVFYGLVIFGLIMVGRGIMNLSRAGKVAST